VSTNVDMDIIDKKGTSSWNINQDIEANINIIGFEDPLYVVNSYGKLTNKIRVTPFEQFVIGGDIDNLLTHLNESYYITTNISPNYLMRLEGNLGNSSYGIESLVNLQEFLDQGLSIQSRSVVDYIYFGNQSTTNYNINDTPSWFRLDEQHLSIYDVEDMI